MDVEGAQRQDVGGLWEMVQDEWRVRAYNAR